MTKFNTLNSSVIGGALAALSLLAFPGLTFAEGAAPQTAAVAETAPTASAAAETSPVAATTAASAAAGPHATGKRRRDLARHNAACVNG